MKNFRSSFKFIFIAFISLFAVNFGVMYMFFGVNVIAPFDRLSAAEKNNAKLNSAELKPYSGMNAVYEDTRNASSVAIDLPTGMDKDLSGAADADAMSGRNESLSAWYMSKDEVECFSELSLSDKLSGLSLISKIGKEDADRIYDLADDGITCAELEEIKTILNKKLTAEEMDIVDGLLEKNKELYASKLG